MVATNLIKILSDKDLEIIYNDLRDADKLGVTSNLFFKYAIQVKVLYSIKNLSEAMKMTENLIYKEIADRYFNKINRERQSQGLRYKIYE